MSEIYLIGKRGTGRTTISVMGKQLIKAGISVSSRINSGLSQILSGNLSVLVYKEADRYNN